MTTGIDTPFIVALHTLAAQSFADGRTAALPQPPIGFTLRDLKFDPPAVAEDRRRAQQFALKVNSSVQVPVAIPAEPLLWIAYADVLDPTQVELAEREPSAAQTAAYNAALALLTDEVRSTYFACKLQFMNAQFEFNRVKLMKPADGSEQMDSWMAQYASADLTRQQAETKLNIDGKRLEVEAALATIQQWTGSATLIAWQQRLDDLRDDILGAADGPDFPYTTFSPSDVADGRGWLRFDLPADRIGSLLAAATPALQALAGALPASGTSMTVELTCVEIHRPWFNAGVFASQAWRYRTANHEPISDGATPRSGRYPYIISGMVLARSLAITSTSAQVASPAAIEERVEFLRPGLTFDAIKPDDHATTRLNSILNASLPAERRHPQLDRLLLADAAESPQLRRVQPTVEVGGAAEAMMLQPEPLAIARPESVRSFRALVPVDEQAFFKRRSHIDFVSPEPASVAPPEAAPPAASVLVADYEAIVVAYLLEPVDTAPNPDLTLTWPS